jgi:hypothetical protein
LGYGDDGTAQQLESLLNTFVVEKSGAVNCLRTERR